MSGKRLNLAHSYLALIGNCGHVHFSYFLFCGRFTEVLGCSANTSKAESCQTMALSYLCK